MNFSDVFPHDVAALFTDRSVDFAVKNGGPIFSDEQTSHLARAIGPFKGAANIRQVHGDEILVVTERPGDLSRSLKEADAVITNVPGLPIVIRTADCLPVFLYDPQCRCIGLVHAGWRGSEQQITAKTVEAMKKIFGTSPADLHAALGPAIRQEHYQVGPEFKERFSGYVTQRPEGCYLDLVKVNTDQLNQLGVPSEHIYDSRVCTCCDEQCFSYRREKERAGRHLSLMMLKASTTGG